MTTRCNLLARAGAMLVLTLMLFGAQSALHAQVACVCDHYTIAIDPGVNCALTICYQVSPRGPILCTTVRPGGTLQIPCPVYQVGVQLCNGTSYVIIDDNPVAARCTGVLQIARDCCVRACRTLDAAGCPLINVTAAPCLSRC